MPKLLDRLKKQIMKGGKTEEQAYAIARASLEKYGYLRKGTNKLTAKGLIKQSLPEGVKGIPKKIKKSIKSKVLKKRS